MTAPLQNIDFARLDAEVKDNRVGNLNGRCVFLKENLGALPIVLCVLGMFLTYNGYKGGDALLVGAFALATILKGSITYQKAQILTHIYNQQQPQT